MRKQTLMMIGNLFVSLATVLSIEDTPPSAVPTDVQSAWGDLMKDEPLASTALLKMSDVPKETVKFFSQELKPLTLSLAELDELLDALASEDETIWKPAFERLQYADPRLALGLESLMERMQDEPARSRLVHVMSRPASDEVNEGRVELQGNNFRKSGTSWWAEHQIEKLNSRYSNQKPLWTRAVRALVLLEHIGTPEARAIVDAMATGHPEAQPTRVAKDLISTRK